MVEKVRADVAVNELGRVIGESHPKAKLTDGEVEVMRVLREDHGWSLQRLADAFKCGLRTAADICNYHTRAQVPRRYVLPRHVRRVVSESRLADEADTLGDNAVHDQTQATAEPN